MGTSANHRRRPSRLDVDLNVDRDTDELLDDLDAGDARLGVDLTPDLTADDNPRARPQRRRAKRARPAKPSRAVVSDDVDEVDEWGPPERDRDRKRVEVSEPFKCRHCRAFVGIPPTGGRNRNHCPLCLYSLHVDAKTPGDRAADCRSLMAPVGTFYRPNLEQVVVHRCLGCGFVRYNRVAADDNPIVLTQLPLLDPNELRATDDER